MHFWWQAESGGVSVVYSEAVVASEDEAAAGTPALTHISDIVQLSGSPVAGATVRAIDQTSNTYVGTRTTDVNGRYVFNGLTPGHEYHVTAEHEVGATKYTAQSKAFLLPS
jgi:uncharacterized surface anchored protein